MGSENFNSRYTVSLLAVGVIVTTSLGLINSMWFLSSCGTITETDAESKNIISSINISFIWILILLEIGDLFDLIIIKEFGFTGS